MKILHVIETLNIGGAERLLVTLLPELASQGMEVHVAVMQPPMPLKSELEAKGIRVHVLPRRGKWHIFRQARDLARLAKSLQAEIIHGHLYFPVLVTALGRSCGWLNAATHATFHNLAYAGANKKTWKLEARRRLATFIVRRGIDQPQAVSQISADHYAASYGLKNIAVLHNAFDPNSLNGNEREAGDTIVVPGRLVHEKGHADLIEALKQLQPDCPPVTFAGDGPLRNALETEIEAAQLPVSITGQLDHARMLQTIASAQLVVVPSRLEGFGLTALEAIALGKAVVATNVGGLPEVLGELGHKVAPNQPTELAEALKAALGDPDWIAEQEAAGPEQAAKFAVATIARKQIALYQETHRAKGRRT
ncbi:glycosyltransferase family 4 protein [Roseicyclus sp.]